MADRVPSVGGDIPPALAAEAVAALRAGAIVCIPTETMYGLAVDIRDRAALARLSALKARPDDVPFGLIAGDVEAARALCAVWPERAAALARACWPGPLTLVLPARQGLAPQLVGPGGGVGVRVPDHCWPFHIAALLGSAITATSANPSGSAAATSVAQARSYFGDEVSLYLDAGPSPTETPSTVARVSADGSVEVLRRGALAVPGLG